MKGLPHLEHPFQQAIGESVSTRQVGEVLEPVLGESYSPQTVSRIARGLDQAVEAFHQRRLRDEYVYIFLDGVVLKVRDSGGQVRRRWVLVAYGITVQGQREVIAYLRGLRVALGGGQEYPFGRRKVGNGNSG